MSALDKMRGHLARLANQVECVPGEWVCHEIAADLRTLLDGYELLDVYDVSELVTKLNNGGRLQVFDNNGEWRTLDRAVENALRVDLHAMGDHPRPGMRVVPVATTRVGLHKLPGRKLPGHSVPVKDFTYVDGTYRAFMGSFQGNTEFTVDSLGTVEVQR